MSVIKDTTPYLTGNKHEPVVYAILNGGCVKIGTTTNLKQRLSGLSLRANHVFGLIEGGGFVERELHERFTAQRHDNTEWFNVTPEILRVFLVDEKVVIMKTEDGHPWDHDYGNCLHDPEAREKRIALGKVHKDAAIERLFEGYGMPLGAFLKDHPNEPRYWREFEEPLTTVYGRKWLHEVFMELGATAVRTDENGDVSTSEEDLNAAIKFYSGSTPEYLRRKGIDPDNLQVDKVVDLCQLVMVLAEEDRFNRWLWAHREFLVAT